MTAPIRLILPVSAEEEQKQEQIEILSLWLERAKKGELLSVIVIAEHLDEKWSHSQSGTKHFSQWVGHLEILKQAEIMKYLNDNQ